MKGKKQKEPVGFNPAEIFAALALLEKERGIPQSFMMEKIVQALTTAYKRDHADVENVIVDVDEAHQNLKMFVQKNVVEEEDYVGNAFLSGKLWQYFVAVHPRRGPGQEKRPFAARYCRHASKMSWFWQDMFSMYSKCPAKRRSGIHLAGILPSRRPFPVRIPQIMHNGQILPRFFDSSFMWELCDSCLRGSLVHDQR